MYVCQKCIQILVFRYWWFIFPAFWAICRQLKDHLIIIIIVIKLTSISFSFYSFQIKYYHDIGQVISCSNNPNTALVIGMFISLSFNVILRSKKYLDIDRNKQLFMRLFLKHPFICNFFPVNLLPYLWIDIGRKHFCDFTILLF